jgi:hypothetical protein
MEIAFYEQEREITFYAVRNTARSNASRLGLDKIANQLLLSQSNEEGLIIIKIAQLLEVHDFQARFASADECVNLSINTRLLRSEYHLKVRDSLRKRYERLNRLMIMSRS